MPKKKMGRPLTPINWEEFDKLCHLQCTQEEIAAWFNCDTETIIRAVKREKKQTFEGYWKQKAASGRISLRRAQWQLATSGNPTMLIWLGKQILGQKQDVPQSVIFNSIPINPEQQKHLALQEIRSLLEARDQASHKEPLEFVPATGGLLTR